jgi:hypothetical protein
MITGITAMQGRAMGVGNAVLMRAFGFQSPPLIALEAMEAAHAVTLRSDAERRAPRNARAVWCTR